MNLRRNILWIDGLSALTAGTVVLIAAGWLHPWTGLPERLLIVMGVVNLLYAAYSLSLARRVQRPKYLVLALIVANLSWAPFCIFFAFANADTAKLLGYLHLLGEAAYVTILACLEWRWRKLLIRP